MSQPDPLNFKEAVIEALICNHIYQTKHETNAITALSDLISWECEIALDPAVSSQAQDLVAKGFLLGLLVASND